VDACPPLFCWTAAARWRVLAPRGCYEWRNHLAMQVNGRNITPVRLKLTQVLTWCSVPGFGSILPGFWRSYHASPKEAIEQRMLNMFRAISVQHFRGFSSLQVGPLDRFNLILGKNNVGKTALLEAFYLLLGPTNPELPTRINAFRGIEQVRLDPEEIWGWLFYEKDTTKRIELDAEMDNKKHRRLKIYLAEPKTIHSAEKRKPLGRMMSVSAAVGTGSPRDLVIKLQTESGESTQTRAFLKETTIAFERDRPIRFPESIFMSARAGYTAENPERFSKLEELGQETELIPSLQVLEPRLKRLAVLVTGAGPVIHGDIGIGRLVPIPMMGEGLGRLLTLLLCIAGSQDGVTIIDEIDIGLHYSSMVAVWKAIATSARKLNVQVVSTTHSWECLRAAHEAFGTGDCYDFRLHRLDRREGAVQSITYDKGMIDMALETGMELR
jgi:hypothetical protein